MEFVTSRKMSGGHFQQTNSRSPGMTGGTYLKERLNAVPGRHFMTETGVYAEIGRLMRLGDQSGEIVTASAELLSYSAQIALRLRAAWEKGSRIESTDEDIVDSRRHVCGRFCGTLFT